MSAKQHFLTIDCGTQSLRAMVFDPKGSLVAKAQVPFTPYVAPKPGYAEQDPDVYWRALCRACKELWDRPGVNKDALVAMAVTTQRGSIVNVDRLGQPLRPAMLWLDSRVTEGQSPIGGMWGLIFKLAGVSETVAHLQTNAECNWLRTHQPEVWKKTHKYLLLSGYLNFKLTGQYMDSVANQVGYIPFDYKKLRWASERDWKWDALGISPDVLPTLIEPGMEMGQLTPQACKETGLPKKLPVIAAAADKACEVLGSGSLTPEIGCVSYGTTATFNITSQRYMEAIPFIPPYPAAIPKSYSVEIQIFRGYWMVEWFKQQFSQNEVLEAEQLNVKPEVVMEEMIRHVPPGSDGLLLQPYWSPGIKIPGSEARGSVLGFTDIHTRGHFYRAVLEGLAFAMREGKERIEKRSKQNITSLRVSGGGSQSDTAMQITADIFGLPAVRPHTFETSGLGAAMITAVSRGIHPDFETAIAEMSHTGKVFEPKIQNRKLYDQIYQKCYTKMYKRVRPLYQALSLIYGAGK